MAEVGEEFDGAKELVMQKRTAQSQAWWPGICALVAVNARGVDATNAARALWREFLAARTALLAFVPPSGSMGPLRKA